MNREISYRALLKTTYCRGCDKEMSKGELVISTYSYRNRGQYIYFCTECSELIGKLINTYKNEKT